MFPLHGRLTVKTLQQFRHLTIIIGYLTDGDVHQFPRILVHDDHLTKMDGSRLELYLQVVTVLDLHTLGLIA